MNESKSRIWKKVSLYYVLTLLFSGVFNALVLHAGKVDAGNLLYITGAMWSPALAAFVTKSVFHESIRELPWRFGRPRYVWLGYLIPMAYAVPLYLVVWLTGLGGFADTVFVKRTAEQFGWPNLPGGITLALFVLLTATLGVPGIAAKYALTVAHLHPTRSRC